MDRILQDNLNFYEEKRAQISEALNFKSKNSSRPAAHEGPKGNIAIGKMKRTTLLSEG